MSNLWILIGHNRNTILGHEHHCESKCRSRGIVGRWSSSSCCSRQTHRTRICWPDWYSCGRQELHFYSWKMKEHGGQFTSTQLENMSSSESGLKTSYCSTSQFFVEDERTRRTVQLHSAGEHEQLWVWIKDKTLISFHNSPVHNSPPTGWDLQQ